MTGGNHYDTLCLPPDATPAEIREAFAQRSQEHDPGPRAAHRQRLKAREAIAALTAAYETLADPRRRAEYDWRLGIDDLQPLDWGGAMPDPYPLETPIARLSRPLLAPRQWLHVLRRGGRD